MTGQERNQPHKVVVGFNVPGQQSSLEDVAPALSDYTYVDSGSPLGDFIPPDPTAYDLRPSTSAATTGSLANSVGSDGSRAQAGARSPVDVAEFVRPVPVPPLTPAPSLATDADIPLQSASLPTSAPQPLPPASTSAPPTTAPPTAPPPVAPTADDASSAATPAVPTPAPTAATPAAAAAAAPAAALSKEERRRLKEAELAGMQKEKKVLTKQERRAKQEAERAAKAAASAGSGTVAKDAGAATTGPGTAGARASKSGQGPAASPGAAGGAGGTGGAAADAGKGEAAAGGAATGKQAAPQKPEDLFDHLPPPAKLDAALFERAASLSNVHQAIRLLGLDFAAGKVTGGTARCEGMLRALCHVVGDYTTPPGKMLSRDLTTHINTQVNWLVQCRPLSASMGNAIKYLKLMVTKIDPSVPDEEAKEEIIELIHKYIQTKIVSAAQTIVKAAAAGISDGDFVVTLGYSVIARNAIVAAKDAGRSFSVCVVDSRPAKGSWDLVQELLQAGVSCFSVPYTAARLWVSRATKLLLSATAVFNNGSVMVAAGGSGLANIAVARKVDVTICCESIKAHDRNANTSIDINELSDPDELVGKDGRPEHKGLEGWREWGPLFDIYNLKYEIIPPRHGVMIVSELGKHPAMGLPAVRRMNEHV